MDVAWVAGFAFFIRRGLWEQVGGFDQRFPDYGNESDLCRRLAEEGYRRVWIRNSYIHHFGEQSYKGRGWRRRHPRAAARGSQTAQHL
jgi:GT2 family glycosyltransferase